MITSDEAERISPCSRGIGAPAQAGRLSLRELARRPLEERHQAIQAARIVVDADETQAWDETVGDGLDE